MKEIIFLVEEDSGGGFTARAVDIGYSIFTEGDTVEELKKHIIQAVECNFEDVNDIPAFIRLHFVKDEVIHYAPAS
jgi:hypothetical protein